MKKIIINKIEYTKPHNFWGILFDFCMVILTGGFWLIWILIRYLRTH